MSSTSSALSAQLTDSELRNVRHLAGEIDKIRADLREVETQSETATMQLDPAWRTSALNLLQYVEFRKHDIRTLQTSLTRLGLSSLGRAEAHVMSTLNAVGRTLHLLAGYPEHENTAWELDFEKGQTLLDAHSQELFGSRPARRIARMMVTMPTEAAGHPDLIHGLLDAGMDCMRINCAHDDQTAWGAMISNLRRAEIDLGRHCRVLMDLPGPKLRTGAIQTQGILKCRPQRDALGRVTEPSHVWLYPATHVVPRTVHPEATACIPIPDEFFHLIGTGDCIKFADTRGALRRLKVVGSVAGGCWAQCSGTFYLCAGIELHLERSSSGHSLVSAKLGEVPPTDPHIPLKKGDLLDLTRSQVPGHAAIRDDAGKLITAACIPCTLPEVFESVKPGERIALDDGKMRGVIKSVTANAIQIELTHLPPNGAKLRSDKGINLPDTQLNLAAPTPEDLSHLPFLAAHADMVGVSFVERPGDLLALQAKLKSLGGKKPGIVLKIETKRGFQNLPSLIFAAMHNPTVGVMIARGDLAVECGFERLAEVQEEILWLCEAAHMPVIWATQVLESMAKSGQPSRAEITDAAMGERAECVMLNKGPHILAAMRSLDDILRRMEGHQHKKQALLRKLRSWGNVQEICSWAARDTEVEQESD